MNKGKQTDELNEQIVVLKNYCNVLKKKHEINKDTVERNQKLINNLKEENQRLTKKIKNAINFIQETEGYYHDGVDIELIDILKGE